MANLNALEKAMPVAPVKLIVLPGAAQLGNLVNQHLVEYRRQIKNIHRTDHAFNGYIEDDYLVECTTPRFGSGEGKGVIGESVRGKDLISIVLTRKNKSCYNDDILNLYFK